MSQFSLPLEELVNLLPAPVELGRVKANDRVDCFVGIEGFEPRCYSAARELRLRGWRARNCICVRYSDKEMSLPNRRFEKEVDEHLTGLATGSKPIAVDHDDHNLTADFGAALIQRMESNGVDLDSETTHVAFDVTVGSSRLLLEGLHALLQRNARVTIVYSEASKYRPFFEEYLSYAETRRVHAIDAPEFLTRGVERVEVLRQIPGSNADARPAYLVIFPSFAFTRSSAIIDEMSPSRVQWIFGVPHLVENRWRLDAQKDYHRALIEGSHRQCYVSTFDYRETFEVLERIYRKRRDNYNILVASLGSKMQKVGQVLFHLLRPEVAAVVSIPRIWDPDRFSSDEPRAIYTVDLGSCRALREWLWRSRRLKG